MKYLFNIFTIIGMSIYMFFVGKKMTKRQQRIDKLNARIKHMDDFRESQYTASLIKTKKMAVDKLNDAKALRNKSVQK